MCDYETIGRLIARTTTAKGLAVTCRLDRRNYSTDRNLSAAAMGTARLRPNGCAGGWNYVIVPSGTG